MKDTDHIGFMKSLSSRAILGISVLLTIISVVLSLFFTYKQKNSMEEELKKRSIALSNNLAYNARYRVLTNMQPELQRFIHGVMNEEDIIYTYIVDQTGIIIAHSDTFRRGEETSLMTLKDIENMNTVATSISERISPLDDETIFEIVSPIEISRSNAASSEEVLFMLEPEEQTDPSIEPEKQDSQAKLIGKVVLGVSTKNLNKSIGEIQSKGILITLVIVFCGIVLTVIVISRSVTRPLRKLMYATKIVALGDLDYHVEVGRKDEIGILSQSFNQMTTEIKKSRKKIEDWNRILESRVIERTKELSKKNMELKKYSDELQRAFEELKTLDKSKDDFLSLVSHELRTPLSSIVAYTEVLLDGMAKSKEDERKYLGIIKSESDRLTRLINNVLDLSKMEAGRMPFEFNPVELGQLISMSIAGLSSLADKRRHTIINNLSNSDISVSADADKIIQVLSNIITNAMKFSDDGKTITIAGKKRENKALISITDEGFGIKKSDRNKVFDKFQQIEDVEHHSDGSGLGMPISKIIIENHNGKIWFDSEAGKGTTFYFTLPLI